MAIRKATRPLPVFAGFVVDITRSRTELLMANALHFQRDKERTLGVVQSYLKPHGKLILVEYNTDRGNTWVPYPLSFDVWLRLAQRCGFSETRLLTRAPSSFLGEFYSAVSWKP